MQKIFQVWYETDVGPCFSSREKAVKHVADDYGITIDEAELKLKSGWYPDIKEITVDDPKFMASR